MGSCGRKRIFLRKRTFEVGLKGSSQLPGQSTDARKEKSPVKNINNRNQKSIELEGLSYEDIATGTRQPGLGAPDKKSEPARTTKSPARPQGKPAATTKPTEESRMLDNLFSSFQHPLPVNRSGKPPIDLDSYRYDNNKYYKIFLEESDRPRKIVKNNILADGKVQNMYDNNVQEVIFPNGANRQTFPSGYSIVHFINRDIKQTLPDGTTIYFYADHDTTQITLPKEKTDVG